MRKIALIAGAMMMAPIAQAENPFAGPYVGLNAGFVQGEFTSTEYSGPWDYGEYSVTSGLENTFGVQLGYNFAVSDNVVVGLEYGYAMPDISEEVFFNSGTYENSAEWQSESSFRVRGGVVVDKALMYLTAGVVEAEVDFVFGDLTDVGGAAYIADSVSNQGLTVGAGMEVAVSDSFSVRGEFMVNDSESEEYPDFDGDTGHFQAQSKSFTIGANFLF
jgi:outer membrane immunogenic protein